MSIANARTYMQAAKSALRPPTADTQAARTHANSAMYELQQEPAHGDPPISEWIILIQALIELIDEAIAEINELIEAIDAILEQLGPEEEDPPG